MSDFQQNGAIATFHRLSADGGARMESELRRATRRRKLALILPCHAGELGTPALRGIVAALQPADWIEEIIIGLDGASAAQHRAAQREFAPLPQRTHLLWNDGPHVRRILKKLCAPREPGKGRNLWLGLGVALASGRCEVAVAHDCDILTYDRELPARLAMPVATLGYDFCKGYAARFTDKLNGRVMRLMFTPLLAALEDEFGPQPLLRHYASFRYPLSGEVCLDLALACRLRITPDWGVEAGLLAEIHRLAPPRVCQSEVADRYDHKHQALSPRDPQRGLHRMAIDIARCIFAALAAESVPLDRPRLDRLARSFRVKAAALLLSYAGDAAMNGLSYDMADEKRAVATFSRALREAADAFLHLPGVAPLPAWERLPAGARDELLATAAKP